MAFESAQAYGTNIDGDAASIGASTQINPAYFYKKALIDIVAERYFGQLADVRAMPKHMGKTIKQHHYIPMLDDENVNDQGISAGAGFAFDALAASWFVFDQANPNELVPDGTVAANSGGFATKALAEVVAGYDPLTMAVFQGYGNLYASSKDIGAIKSRMPALTEHGGRVNRVGFTRKTLSATLEKYGFFDEYTQESLDFDTDSDLMMHITREALRGANEMVEDLLQKDLLEAAGVVVYCGDATSRITLEGTAAGGVDELDYDTLMKLSITLDDNRCPKATTLINGSRQIDTKTVGAARYIYCGSEMIPTLEKMVDFFSNKAFIPVEQYAHAGNLATGEYGAIGHFRFIIVPEMGHYPAAGAVGVETDGYRTTSVNLAGGAVESFDVFPLLCVGSGSFTTVGFQTNGKTVKFKITHKKPGRDTADRNDPYGETGFYSIKWYYGFMALRPEWIARIESVGQV